MIRRPGGLRGRRHLWHMHRSAADSRAGDLHALLDKVLAAGVTPLDVEADLVYLLDRAKEREHRDEFEA